MLSHYLTIAYRNLIRQKSYSFINIGGLSVGLAVALLIGLWLYDELTFNHYHQHYDRIAQVLEHEQLEGGTQTMGSLPLPLSEELRTNYPADFESVVATSWSWNQIVTYQDKKLIKRGSYAEAGLPEMLTLQMLQGTRKGLQDPASVLVSASLAQALFGAEDPLGKAIKISNQYTLQVQGVYQDLPQNTTFADITFIAPIALLFDSKQAMNNWQSSSFKILAQLRPQRNLEQVSAKIKDALYLRNQDAAKPSLFLHPMSKWHLYSEFRNGVNTGGRIQFVWLFGLIGVFVLLLAAINFMNLATARSGKRAKEVGVRKTMGSLRSQLVYQFMSESWLVVLFSFGLALLIVELSLPEFNQLAGKQLVVLWREPLVWLFSLGFISLTGLLAGSYPALYLSGFQPVKVLKGTFRVGRWATIPRKVLVVVQFTVSVSLIIGTLIVHEQIQFAKNRPIGYNRQGLITITINTPQLQGRFDALRHELLATGAIVDMAESSSPVTSIWSSANNLEWKGKDPARQALFGTISVTPGFGKVVGWQVLQGREFSREFTTDSSTFLLNEAAVKLMGLQHPVGETIKWHDQYWKVIGVVKDMVMNSPFEPAQPTVFMMNTTERPFNVIHLKLNPTRSTQESLRKIGSVFKVYNPESPFLYQFADQEYAKKFAFEERIGQIAAFFAGLAIFISCLGLFGLASFVAEQRTKEIGIRKVLGASVLQLWGLLSREFVLLVGIAFLVATPLAYYFLSDWLSQYAYRTNLSWPIFALGGLSVLLITLLTVSFQAIKAALANPVKSLRSE